MKYIYLILENWNKKIKNCFDRSKISFGTVYIMVAAGYKSDLFLWLITEGLRQK
jgi:hypothetical protein